MSIIRFHNLTKRYDSKSILRNIPFRLDKGEKIGLIGKNGVGKSTVLKLILGQEEPTEGTIEVNKGVKVGYFSQLSELSGEASILDVLEQLFTDIHLIEKELSEIEGALKKSPQGSKLDQLINRQTELFAEMEYMEGWTYKNRIDAVLTKLGFTDVYRNQPIDQLSGGWCNRAALARILLEEPDILLMDEPTNYLDLTSTQVMEHALVYFPGAIVVVSHDRFFIDKVATRLLVFEGMGRLNEINGNWTTWQTSSEQINGGVTISS